jgi:ABC-2 type transport system ATP-binding protein
VADVLRARDLKKTFRDVRAVDGIDLDVAAGERVALLGPNGAGKTTTLLMLLGAISPDSGTIEIAGHRLPGGRAKAMARVGFAAGYLPLAERMRVGEFLRMYGELYGITDTRSAIAEGLERFRISHLAKVMGTELSSGQRTLVGIVKATLHRPELLVLDEPTASLDPDVAFRVRAALLDLCREDGAAMLITSHNMLEVERVAERVIFLAKGKVVANGTAAEIAQHYGQVDLEEVFLHLAGTHEPRAHEQQTDRPA